MPAATSGTDGGTARQRVPAAERRDALIEAAVHEFAHGGLHGTPVDRIARRVGVAQPYVFSLFGGKRELFVAAVERSFERALDVMRDAAAGYVPSDDPQAPTIFAHMGDAYTRRLTDEPELFMLQHQAYAACSDPEIRVRVRECYARIVAEAGRLSGGTAEELDNFMRWGVWLNVLAAMGVRDLRKGCEWVHPGGPAGSDQPVAS